MQRLDKHKKTAKSQFDVYLDYVRQYGLLRMGWVVQRAHMTELNVIWQKMTEDLNKCDGPCREISHWKKVFTEWKSHTRRKLKYNKTLSDVEKELIEIAGLPSLKDNRKKCERGKCVVNPNCVESSFKDSMNMSSSPFFSTTSRRKTSILILQESTTSKKNGEAPKFLTNSEVTVKEEVMDRISDTECTEEEQPMVEKSRNVVEDRTYESEARQTTIGTETETTECVMVTEAVQTDDQQNVDSSQNSITDRENIEKRDASIQAGQENGNNCRVDGLIHIGNSFTAISRAINRYCDILEKRLI